MIENMIRDMLESEIDVEDILETLTEEYGMDTADAVAAICEIDNET
ncbi:hypothetical protein VPHK567_0181 [Vibrio phage K567]|nr:hypothetical protein MYOV011v1_p0032 [Vibrio phage 6E35.1a]